MTRNFRAALRDVRTLAWPLIISNVTVPLLGLVDTAVMGHLTDSRYLGAVALGSTLFSFIYWGFGFLRMGTTGLTAQADGRADAPGVKRLLAQAVLMAAVIGAALILLHAPLLEFGLGLLGGSEQVASLADRYASVRITSAPAALANYAMLGWALGLGRSRIALLLMVTNNGLNIVLDLWFVVGLGMTVDGVALGSVLADYGTLALGAAWAWRTAAGLGGPVLPSGLLRWSSYRELARVNLALFVRTLCLLFAMAFFQAQGARLGNTTLAANAVLMQFLMLTSYALDGYAHAAEALVGRALGAGNDAGFRRVLSAATLWSFGTAMAASVLFAVTGESIIAVLTDVPTVRQAATDYLGWAVAMPLLAVGSYLLDGVFIGATRTAWMRDTMILALVIYLGCWYASDAYGNGGLWFSFAVFTTIRSASLGIVLLDALRHHRWLPERGNDGHIRREAGYDCAK